MGFIARLAAPLFMSLAATVSAATLPSLPNEPVIDATHGDIRFDGDGLRIAADKGTDLFTDPAGKDASDNAPRALFAAEGDFVLSARVSPRFGGAAYEGAALIAYAGPACWGKLLFERFESGHNGIATTTSRGAGGDDAYHGIRETAVQYLKLVRQGEAYIFYTSPDGTGWNFVRSFALPCGGPVRVGFSAQAPFSEGFAADFSEVRYRTGTIRDYWQGE